MNIHGLQKMTLLDFPEHVACTVFLGGCDFRCPFCHNFGLATGSDKPVMNDGELMDFLKTRTGILDGVAFTGGEPCLYGELPDLLRRIRSLGFATKLDTNGYHPALLKRILDEKLVDYVAMDIKNSPEKYAATCGVGTVDIGIIKESISAIMGSGTEYEFRTTVVEEFHDTSDFSKIGGMIRGADRYFLQCFTDRPSVPFGNLHAPSKEKLEEYAAEAHKYVKTAAVRGV